MRLALLGFDEDALRLARWAVESGQHELLAAYGAGEATGKLRELQPSIRLSENWEELLLGSTVDAVIFGQSEPKEASMSGLDVRELRTDQLRKLVQAAVPLIVVCPACEAIVGFEIDMIRRDVGSVIVPYIPGRHHPGLYELSAIITGSNKSLIGHVEQVTLEREQSDRSRPAVLKQLPRDIALLRSLAGNIRSVTASGPACDLGVDPLGPKPKEPPSLANLSVAFTSDEGLNARWSVSPPTTALQARLTLNGQRGKAVLTMPPASDWSVDIAGDEYMSTSFTADSDLEQVFWQLTHSLPTEPLYDDDAWLAACRDQEAAEAVDRSLLRGRTIELFNEEHTEEASFKGIMAMGGCLILVCTLGLVLIAAIVEGLHLPMRNWPLWRLWPIYLLAPLTVFLLLQLLSLALKRNEDRVSKTLPVS
jgi:hypothetical protein